MEKFNYYKDQIKKIQSLEHVTIKVTDFNGNSTKYLGLNKDSLNELILLVDRIEKQKHGELK